MKKRGMIITAPCILSLISLSSSALFLLRGDEATAAGSHVEDTPLAGASETPEIKGVYTLREYEGRIGIFSGGDMETPQMLTDIYTAGLRQIDRESLEQGITVTGMEEVLKLLEDFGS